MLYLHNLHYEKFSDGSIRCIETEIPYTEPNGWCWCKIDTIAFVTKLAGFEYTKYIAPNLCEKGIPLFKGKNVQNGEIVYEFESFIPERISDELIRSQINRKCILTPYVGTIGNIGIHDRIEKFHLGSNVGKIEIYNKNEILLEEYVVAYLRSTFGAKELTKHMKATAQASISIEAIRDVYIPIPPSNEQQRLVCKLHEILNSIDGIDDDVASVKQLIEKAKSSILNLAIRGKLVPQDPDDEPATMLLERIRCEKEELIKAGKLKKDKRESVIFRGEDNSYYETIGNKRACIDSEIHYDIPEGWTVERLKNLYSVNPKNDIANDETIVSFVPMNLINDRFLYNCTYELKQWKDCKKGFTHFADGDLGFAKISPCFENRKSVVFSNLKNGYGAGTTELYILRNFCEGLNPEYAILFLKSESFIERGVDTYSGTVGQQRIDKNIMMDTIIPIPPQNEQQRIADRVKQLFSILDSIQATIV